MPNELIKPVITVIIIGLVFYSIILHEVSHALVSHWLGDDTAKRNGRLSLNPLVHIEWFGTVILPLILYFSAGFIYGYARPVPLNPNNFTNYKRDVGLSALAGPITNILIAIAFAIVYHTFASNIVVQYICTYVVFLNLLLAFFNFLPFPPLDGSKVLGIFLPDELYYKWTMQEKTGMMILFGVIIVSNLMGWNLIGRVVFPPVQYIMTLLGMWQVF